MIVTSPSAISAIGSVPVTFSVPDTVSCLNMNTRMPFAVVFSIGTAFAPIITTPVSVLIVETPVKSTLTTSASSRA